MERNAWRTAAVMLTMVVTCWLTPATAQAAATQPVEGNSVSVLEPICKQGPLTSFICVKKGTGVRAKLYWAKAGKIIMIRNVRTGDRPGGNPQHRTIEGVHRVYMMHKKHQIIGSNPPEYMEQAIFFEKSQGLAFHWSKYYQRDGYGGASLGCVNIASEEDATRLYDGTKINDIVLVRGRV